MIQQRTSVSIDWLCDFFGRSRQAFYQKRSRKIRHNIDEELIVDLVDTYRHKMRIVGAKKLHLLLQPQLQASGIKCGRDKLLGILRRRNMLIRPKCRRGFTKTEPISRHFRNLVKEMAIDKPETIWVGDTTGLAINDGLSYLVLITDAYSRRIMGYNYQRTKDRNGPLKSLKMALNQRLYPDRPLIYHSDGGTEFYNKDFLGKLAKNSIKASCSAPSKPGENPIAERINGILKQEFLMLEDNRTFQKMTEVIPEAIGIYNEIRPHSSIDYKTPQAAHQCCGPIKKRWSYKPEKRERKINQIGCDVQTIMKRMGYPALIKTVNKEEPKPVNIF